MSLDPHELEELGRRIERLTLEPESISAPLARLFRPFLHRIGWRPRTRTSAVTRLVEALEAAREFPDAHERAADALATAVRELQGNLSQVERATVITGRPSLAHAAWLRRCWELLVLSHRALDGAGDRNALVIATRRDPALLLPPLVMRRARAGVDALDEGDEPAWGDGENEPLADPTRVLELQLDTIDHLLAAAREEDALLGRRRRLLDAARQLLLDTSAALALDAEGVQQRMQSIAQQITRLSRYQAAGLRPDVSLLHQARTALARGEHDRLFAALSVLRRRAADTNDADVTSLTTLALERLTGGPTTMADDQASLVRSANEVLGERVVAAVEEGYRRAREREPTDEERLDPLLAATVKNHYAPGQERAMLAHALSVDGCFEVGGVLSPVRIQEEHVRACLVPYPTQRLELVPAGGPQDLGSALIEDPRTILLDLAAGRLLARRFVRDEVVSRPRTVMQGEVRVYVLDGSGSMLGPRARMRDAILVAELATVLARLERPREHGRVVLFYRYFDEELGPVSRVDEPGAAIEAIRDVTATTRTGGTDIEGALLSSLRLVLAAKQEDADLARAQIVLVTDGEASVDERKVLEARRAIGDLPVGVSVIALGQENPALRELVAHQRASDERAFYHFIPDAHLERLSECRIDDEISVHLPPVPRPRSPATMQEQLGALLEELADLQRSRREEALRELDRVDRDRRVERVDVDAAGEGERARLEALHHDDLGLQRRYLRWFPPPLAAGPVHPRDARALQRALPPEGTKERDDLDAVLVVLATIAEVVETVGSARLARQADAVDLLERLLPDARLSPARYQEIVREHPGGVEAGLVAVHGATRSGLGWQLEGRPRAER